MKASDTPRVSTLTGASQLRALGMAAIAAITLQACSQSDTPYVDMCQKITGNLAGSVESWDKVEKNERSDFLVVDLAYSGASSGNANCKFIAGTDGYKHSPYEVILNGQKVPFKKLLAAAAKSSGETIAEEASTVRENTEQMAADASEKATELAGKAGETASELAGQAREAAGVAKEKATELAGQAGETAGALSDKAKEVAGDLGDKAREAALDATKAVQQKLEK